VTLALLIEETETRNDMRAPVLALGIVLLAVGSILYIMGPTTYQVPYTDTVTSDKSSSIVSSQTYTVNPGYYYYIYDDVDLSGKDSGTVRIKGSFTVSIISAVDFYLFDSTNYNNWKNGYSATPLNTAARVASYSFDVPISKSDTYYLVFNTPGGVRVSYSWSFTVTATFVWKETQTLTKYRTAYDYTRGQVGVVIAVAGLVCAIAGAAAKGKKAPPPPVVAPAQPPPVVPPVQPSPPPPPVYQPPPPPGFKRCPYCGTQMPVQATFCGVCGRRIL